MLASKLSSSVGTNSASANYIEDVFSTYLYTGTDATQTITNAVDLSTYGGMVWIKDRDGAFASHRLTDFARGTTKQLSSNRTDAQTTNSTTITAFNTTGFTLGTGATLGDTNSIGNRYASWTFRKQPKFFDVVTVSHTNGVDNTIDFSGLGTIGCVIIKRTDSAQNWYVWHRSLGNGYYGLFLNSTNSPSNFGTAPVSVSGTTVTMTDSSAVGSYFGTGTYVVYAYAHNAGGFGLTGTDNVISCGSFTTNGSGNVSSVSLGYEPQWVLYKTTDVADNWRLVDSMRGMPVTAPTGEPVLKPNLSDAEQADAGVVVPNATGFSINGGSPSFTYIYIAIRRGPMKVPTDGTSVFSPVSTTSSANPLTVTTGFPVDLSISREASTSSNDSFTDRLRGGTTTSYALLFSNSTGAEITGTGLGIGFASNTSIIDNGYNSGNTSKKIYWSFQRAPSFFDEVCYTGAYSASVDQVVSHNLAVPPELLILKKRSGAGDWAGISTAIGLSKYLVLNSTAAADTFPFVSAVTSSTFSLGKIADNYSETGSKYVAYLFATCAGVSKCTAFTGTGTLQTINCGFTAGSRFVLIKRTDAAGDWYVWDSSRGLSSSTDPYLLLNSTAAEVTSTNWVDTTATGFQVTAASGNNVNINGATYIGLAIA